VFLFLLISFHLFKKNQIKLKKGPHRFINAPIAQKCQLYNAMLPI